MRQDWEQDVHVLAHRLGPAGQIDDERLMAQPSGGARERRERLDLEGFPQQQLRDAGSLESEERGVRR